MIKFSAFRAVDDKALCKEYIEGHVKVLTDYGITNVTSNNPTWLENPNIYCVVARNESGELVGGIRVQVVDGIHPLPVEIAIGDVEPNIYNFVKELAVSGGAGELCGLWNSKKVKGMGVSVLLTRAAISMINQFKIQMLTGICGGYTLPMFTKAGFVINTSLGDHGKFLYPNENNVAQVVGILNAMRLETANPYDREQMLNLRQFPRQIRMEEGPKGTMEIEYDMVIPNIATVQLPEDYLKGNKKD
jgi:hypothetical protein